MAKLGKKVFGSPTRPKSALKSPSKVASSPKTVKIKEGVSKKPHASPGLTIRTSSTQISGQKTRKSDTDMNLSISEREKLRALSCTPMEIMSPCSPRLSPRMTFKSDLRESMKTKSLSLSMKKSSSPRPATNAMNSLGDSLWSPRQGEPLSPRAVIPGTSTYLKTEYSEAVQEQMETNHPLPSMLHLQYALLLENTATSIQQLDLADQYYEKAIDIGIDEHNADVDVVPFVALNRAHMLFHRIQDAKKAERWYRIALSREPTNTACQFGLAQFLYSIGLTRHKSRTRKLLKTNEPIVLTDIDFGGDLRKQEAIQYFGNVKVEKRTDPEILFNAACFYRDIGDYTNAEKCFKGCMKHGAKESIIKGNPYTTHPYYRKQVFALFLIDHVPGRREIAYKLLQDARKESKNDPKVIMLHAKALRKMKDEDIKVDNCYKYSLKKMANNDASLYWDYADFLSERIHLPATAASDNENDSPDRDYIAEANKLFTIALALEDKNPTAWRAMQYGMFLWKKLNNPQEALAQFNRADSLDPFNPECLSFTGQLIRENFPQQIDRVTEMFLVSLKARPNDFNLALASAEFMMSIKKWRKADYAFTRACSIADAACNEAQGNEKVSETAKKMEVFGKYANFLIHIRQQFKRAHKYYIESGHFDEGEGIYKALIEARVAKINRMNTEREEEVAKTNAREIARAAAINAANPKAKAKPPPPKTAELIDMEKDPEIYRYHKAMAQFYESVTGELDKAQEKINIYIAGGVGDGENDVDVCLTGARIKVKLGEVDAAFALVEKALQNGYSDSKEFAGDESLKKLNDPENKEQCERYNALVKNISLPMEEREIKITKKSGGGKKKKK